MIFTILQCDHSLKMQYLENLPIKISNGACKKVLFMLYWLN